MCYTALSTTAIKTLDMGISFGKVLFIPPVEGLDRLGESMTRSAAAVLVDYGAQDLTVIVFLNIE